MTIPQPKPFKHGKRRTIRLLKALREIIERVNDGQFATPFSRQYRVGQLVTSFTTGEWATTIPELKELGFFIAYDPNEFMVYPVHVRWGDWKDTIAFAYVFDVRPEHAGNIMMSRDRVAAIEAIDLAIENTKENGIPKYVMTGGGI